MFIYNSYLMSNRKEIDRKTFPKSCFQKSSERLIDYLKYFPKNGYIYIVCFFIIIGGESTSNRNILTREYKVKVLLLI